MGQAGVSAAQGVVQRAAPLYFLDTYHSLHCAAQFDTWDATVCPASLQLAWEGECRRDLQQDGIIQDHGSRLCSMAGSVA